MATQQQPQARPAAAGKHDQFVEQQLARAGDRVRNLDLAAAALVLLGATLLYGLAVTVTDLCLDLPARARLLGLLAYAAAAVLYLGVTAVSFLLRRVNPYYAARQLEKAVPGAKGSVINWLDLHGRPLPEAIHAALGTRAARDLTRADVEEAIASRRNLWLVVAVTGLLAGLLILFMTAPNRFGSLLARAFAPFRETALPTRTEIFLIDPETGDLTVPAGRKVAFRVEVRGRVPRVNDPGAPRLLFRYNPADPYAQQSLTPDPDGAWATTLLPDQVQNGLWYKVTAGDAETPEYQVRVRSIPQVVRFDVRYHYRPYLHLPDRHDRYPNQRAVFPHVKDYRGTEVTLTLKTNRRLAEARLELELGKDRQDLPGQLLPADPEAVQFRLALERSGSFRVHFLARGGEVNTDRSPYQIDVIEDRAPLVELSKPGKDVELPANGTLQLEGSATDDLGIKGLTLRLRVARGPAQPDLRPKVYREGKSFQLAGGKYPDHLGYKDFVALDKVQTGKGAVFPLAVGMELEYWLEAVDNSDYPDPAGNVGISMKYRVKIGAPEQDRRRQQQERQQARQQQQQHEKKQDEDLARRNKEIEQERQRKEEEARQQDPSQQAKREQQKKEFEKKAEELRKALGEESRSQEKQGEAKGAEASPQKGAAKQQGPPKLGTAKGAGQQQRQAGQEGASQRKDEGQTRQGTERGQAKDGGRAAERQGQQDRGEAKGAGERQPQARARGGQGPEEGGRSTSKAGAPEGVREQPGQVKAQPAGDRAGEAALSKGAGDPRAGRQPAAAQAKGQEPAQPRGTAKQREGNAAGQDAAHAKGAGAAGREGSAKAERKAAAPSSDQAGIAKGGGEDGRKETAAGEPKGKEPGLDRVSRLEEQLRRGDREQEKQAAEELSRLGKEARDPKVRQAADKALKQARQRQEPGQAKGSEGPRDQAEQGRTKGEGGQGKAGGPPEPGQARGPQKGKEADTAKGEGTGGKTETAKKGQSRGKEPGGTLGGRGGPEEPPRASPADPTFAKRAGDLQLDELKKKLTPDVLKKLNWSEQDLQQFLKDARAYKESSRAADKATGPDRLRGGGSALPGSGPRQVGPGAGQLNDPLDSLHVLPPPEFRDAHRRFTSSPPAEGKSGRGNPAPTADGR
jgi:hypothetical protein